MKLEYIDGGAIQYFDKNETIEKIVWLWEYVEIKTDKVLKFGDLEVKDYKHKHVGSCTVHFRHKPPKKLHNVSFEGGYNSQYGMPISEDGSKLFVGHWKRSRGKTKNGLQAYDIESDSLLWWLDEGKIRQIFVYSDYLVALQVDGYVFKVCIHTGEVLSQLKSGTLENMFELDSPYVFVDSIKGKLSVIDTETMSIIKDYGKPHQSEIMNPRNCRSLVVNNAVLQDNILTIMGWDANPPGDDSITNNKDFSRVIDTNFSDL